MHFLLCQNFHCKVFLSEFLYVYFKIVPLDCMSVFQTDDFSWWERGVEFEEKHFCKTKLNQIFQIIF